MRLVSTPDAPTPAGHYSQAVVSNGLVFVSGMLPGPARDGEDDTFDRQVEAALAHCRAILVAAGCGFDAVVQCTAYIVGVEHWPRFNALYAQAFGAHRPARAVVPVPELHHGYLVELQMTAEAPSHRGM